jgi:hypothetical protein
MSLLPQIERELLAAARRTTPVHQRPPRRPRRLFAGVAIAVAVAAVVVLTVGGTRHGRVAVAAADVVADAYRAATPPPGAVLHIVTTTQSFAVHHGRHEHSPLFRQEDWLLAHPVENHGIFSGAGQVSEEAYSDGTYLQWDDGAPDVIHRSTGVAARTQQQDPAASLRRLYRSGRVLVAGRLRIAGVAVWRLKVRNVGVHDNPRPASTMFVDARTFVPIEEIVYGARQTHRYGAWTIVDREVTRYPVFENLPATAAGRALLRMHPHPGAHVVDVP